MTERLENEGGLDMREKQWDFAPAGATARLTEGGGGLWPETQGGSEHSETKWWLCGGGGRAVLRAEPLTKPRSIDV